MRTIIAISVLMLSVSLQAATFKVESFYYQDNSTSKIYGYGSGVVFETNSEFVCSGNSTSKVFVNLEDRNGTTDFMLLKLWPSYFLRFASLSGSEVQAFLGAYHQTFGACEISMSLVDTYPENRYPASIMNFELNDPNDSNPIERVLFRTYVNGTGPSYVPWVFAELDEPMSCNGNMTKLIATKPNKSYKSEIISNTDQGHSEIQVRNFFDLMFGSIDSFSIEKYDSTLDTCILVDTIFKPNPNLNSGGEGSIEEGIRQCIEDPASCGLVSQDELDAAIIIAFEAGINQCKNDPASCNLFGQKELEIAINSGKQQCIDNPSSCGLFSEKDILDAFNDGEQNCKSNPASCGLFSQSDIDKAYLAGTEKCLNDPASCGLFTQLDIENSYQNGVQFCRDNPTACGLYTQDDLDISYKNGVQQCIDSPASCGLYSQNDLDQNLLNYRAALIEELKAVPGAFMSICKKRPDFSLCEGAPKKGNK